MTIHIYEHNKNHFQRHIACKHEFFEGQLIFMNYGAYAIFRKPTLDHVGKQYKVSTRNGWGHIGIADPNLPIGTFEIDPYESNEDQLVIYF